MGRRVVSGGCHPAERKNGDFAALRRLSPDGEELDGVQEEECKMKWKIKTRNHLFRKKREQWADNPPLRRVTATRELQSRHFPLRG
ncbi:unnamed protein product [Spirodela intermedia]|uniref:Uncharacterized protein n=1 Tax=Spirodela intermedia TaxID=51605 RepID=A0A7I8IJE8_SPIIN|nr:unnamed protein product [Spirodela intermedia]CAA6657095.1 unnamed protein product [Spirodela intermedia]